MSTPRKTFLPPLLMIMSLHSIGPKLTLALCGVIEIKAVVRFEDIPHPKATYVSDSYSRLHDKAVKPHNALPPPPPTHTRSAALCHQAIF